MEEYYCLCKSSVIKQCLQFCKMKSSEKYQDADQGPKVWNTP